MNTTSAFPYHLHWNAQDIADAVPLRLFELFDFDAGPNGADVDRCANHPPRRTWRGAYLRANELPAFIRGHR